MDGRTEERHYPMWAGHPDGFLQVNTLLLYIPLLALTYGRNYRQRNEYTRFAWAGGTSGQEFSVFLKHSLTLFSYYSLMTTVSDLRYFLKNIETFSNLSIAIVSQKYREFSMQVENCE